MSEGDGASALVDQMGCQKPSMRAAILCGSSVGSAVESEVE